MIDFSGISLPFGAGDLLSSAVELMSVFGPFILMGLTVFLAPHLWNLARIAVEVRENNSDGRYHRYKYRHAFKAYITGEDRRGY